jgi:hypothetical protein
MIEHRRHAIFHWAFPRIDFGGDAALRDVALSHLLRFALHRNDMETAEFLMEQGFQVQASSFSEWQVIRERTWDPEAVKAFMARHLGQVAALAPEPRDMCLLHSVEDAQAIIEISQLCNPHAFDPTAFLDAFLAIPGDFPTLEDKARVIHLLKQLGAEVNPEYLKYCQSEIRAFLQEWAEDIKEPGCD